MNQSKTNSIGEELPNLEANIRKALHAVKDPEIPAISVVDLGIIREIKADQDGNVTVVMTPTFSGCPAVDAMRKEIEEVVSKFPGVSECRIVVDFNLQWSSNMITERGLKSLKEFGLSAPRRFEGELTTTVLQDAACPVCGSEKTVMRSAFGPAACRAIHFCQNCLETFEQFKPV